MTGLRSEDGKHTEESKPDATGNVQKEVRRYDALLFDNSLTRSVGGHGLGV